MRSHICVVEMCKFDLTRATWHDMLMETLVGIEELYLSPRREGRKTPKVSSALHALVREFGPVVPIVVRKTDRHRYEILVNAETWIAAQRHGYHEVPIVIRRAVTDAQADALLSLKSKENPLQVAKRYAKSLDKLPEGHSHGAIAALARTEGCSRSHIAHQLRLLRLPEIIQQAIGEGLLNLGQAKAIAGIGSADKQLQVTTQAIRGRWSVRQTEKAARAGLVSEQSREALPKDPQTLRVERRLGEQLGSAVSLDLVAGHLIIDYRRNLQVLNGILERIGYSAD